MKKRADILLVERGLSGSQEEAQALLMEGVVWSGNQRIDKAGTQLSTEIALEIRGKKLEFVSRAGDKLKHGLKVFLIEPQDKVCLDIGSSTGGFTDCLIKNGANFVFAVDVGYGLLDSKLRNHPKVGLMEKTNARLLTRTDLLKISDKANQIDLVVSDVSFISLRKIVPNLIFQFPEVKQWLLLFKPQFELSPENILQGGIVKPTADVEGAMKDFSHWMESHHLKIKGAPETSPLAGKKSGNVEYLLLYERI